MQIMITGGAGFIGHHIVEHFLKNSAHQIVIVDKLNYACPGWSRIDEITTEDNRHRIERFSWDFAVPFSDGLVRELEDCDVILHLAAGSHVERSIQDPASFERDNVLGTINVLELARKLPSLMRIIYFGTDEVYGSAKDGISYAEGDRFNPGNPYSASKAAAECFCYAYSNTYGLPIQITNTMNVFGERQNCEKIVPLVVKRVLAGEKVFIHSSSDLTTASTRSYLHARNVAQAMQFMLDFCDETLDRYDASAGKFHIVGEKYMDTLSLAQFIARAVGKKLIYEMVDFHSTRPGHDLRYALDGSKMASLGWAPPVSFETSMSKTIEWTLQNPRWLE